MQQAIRDMVHQARCSAAMVALCHTMQHALCHAKQKYSVKQAPQSTVRWYQAHQEVTLSPSYGGAQPTARWPSHPMVVKSTPVPLPIQGLWGCSCSNVVIVPQLLLPHFGKEGVL